MAPVRWVTNQEGGGKAPPGRVRRLDLLLADVALDVFDASEADREHVEGLKQHNAELKAEEDRQREEKRRAEVAAKPVELTEEQRQRLEESRERVRVKKEQRESEQKAAKQREANIVRFFQREDMAKAAEEVERALEMPIQEEISSIVLSDALSLQADLLTGLKDPVVLRKLKHLQRGAAVDAKGFASECQELILKVQSKVLPKYGFSGDYDGIQKMLQAFDHPSIHSNADFVKNSAQLNELLFGCSFSNKEKPSIFEGDAIHQRAEANLKEEMRRQLKSGEKDDAYKGLASKFFNDRREEQQAEEQLRREAAMIIAGKAAPMLKPIQEEDPLRKFDGAWDDGEGATFLIQAGKLKAPNGDALHFVIFDTNKCSLNVGSEVFEGKFSTDGRLLWGDGSMWVRQMAKGEGSAGPVAVVDAPGEEAGASRGGGGGGGSGGGGGGGTGNSGGGAPRTGGPRFGGGDFGDDEPGGGGGGDGPSSDPSTWVEEAPPGRVFHQTLPIFHPPDDGSSVSEGKSVWKESGMPMIRSQFATGGKRNQRSSYYTMAMAATYGQASPFAIMDALREDVRRAVSQRSATRFVEAMETMENLYPEEVSLKKEINNVLGSLPAADKQAAKRFILEAMPYREKQIFNEGPEHYEAQSVLQEPSWYAEWEVSPQWMWPMPVMFAAHQSAILLKPNYTEQPHKWSFDQ